MTPNRRAFLRRAGIAVGSAAVASTIDNLTLTSSLAQGGGYKALVCVFLNGGNDANNMVIPVGNGAEEYALYSTARTTPGLAFTQAQLAPTNITPTNLGRPFALHPNMAQGFQTNPALLQLWNQNRLAVVCNVGPLVQPLTSPTPRQAYLDNPNLRPYQLFSHSDQQTEHQTCVAERHVSTGWGGRTADRFPPHTSGFPLMTTITNVTHFTIGASTRPLAVSAAPAALNSVLTLQGYGNIAIEPEYSRRVAFDLSRTNGRSHVLVRSAGDILDQSILVARELSINPTITTTFPNTGLANQLLQVAKLIKANRDQPGLGLNRQIFFTQLGGFDTHQNQLGGQGGLFTQLSQAMGSFYNAMVELNLANNVTLFTLSDFNRTFNPAGTGGTVGTDHAWGSHQFVVGGAVRGRNFYGVPGPNGTPFPVLRMGMNGAALAVQDTDTRGRWVPSTAVDAYAATLASWFGVAPADLNTTVFPYLDRFSRQNLDYMNPA